VDIGVPKLGTPALRYMAGSWEHDSGYWGSKKWGLPEILSLNI
jgi:hypothetical protein